MIEFFKNIKTKKMIINHIYYGMNSDEELQKLIDNLSYPTRVAFDGYSIEV